MSENILIPEKSEYKLNEVCGLVQVKSYVLRFWESEFEQIKPKSTTSGQKIYSRLDLDVILQIKKLLFDEKMSIDRAKGEIQKLFSPQTPIVDTAPQHVEEKIISHAGASFSPLYMGEKEIQKLVLLKAKLSSILSQTEAIKQQNNWT